MKIHNNQIGGRKMKNKVTVMLGRQSNLHFYLQSEKGQYYLFSQPYTKGVYEFFRSGKSENELHNYNKWNRNPRLDKTIEKIPMYIKYIFQVVV